MKYLIITSLLATFNFANYHCQSQNATNLKYSKIDFGIDTPSIAITDRSLYWKGGDDFLKRRDYLRRYYFPKNSKRWENYIDTVYHVKLVDTITKLLLNKNLLLANFDVFAFWVDGKYVSKMKEGAEDGTIVDFYYLEDDLDIPYTLYKLTDKGWLWLEEGKSKITLYFENRLCYKYLKREAMPINTFKK